MNQQKISKNEDDVKITIEDPIFFKVKVTKSLYKMLCSYQRRELWALKNLNDVMSKQWPGKNK